MAEVSEPSLGYSTNVWLDSISKVISDAQAGRGGLENLLVFFEEAFNIKELRELRQVIRNSSLVFMGASAKVTKEQMARPLNNRVEDMQDYIPLECSKCSLQTSTLLQIVNHSGLRCISCGSKIISPYIETWRDMVSQGMNIASKPEAVIMYRAYDDYAEAFVAAYKAMKRVIDSTAEFFNWESFVIENLGFHNYLDYYQLGRFRGETKIPREEKQMLQFLSRGPRAGISVEEAEPLIRLALKVVKYGYLYEVLGVAGANLYYNKLSSEYTRLYDTINLKVTKSLGEVHGKRQPPSVTVTPPEKPGYAACFIMPRSAWESGGISKEVNLKPLHNLPVFPRFDMGALQAVFAPLGGGKTFLMSALTDYTILEKKGVSFSFLNDESNSFMFAGIPLFAYSRRTSHLLEILKGMLGMEPQGIPTLTLNVLREEEELNDRDRKNPPTIYDRIIRIEDPRSFRVDFNWIMRELKHVSERYGYSRPVGMVNVRNLKRIEGKENIDAQVTSNLLGEFSKWRKGHLSFPARIVLDEISYIAPTQVVLYASDALHAGHTISDVIKESRRDAVSIDYATQRPLEILAEFREATNVFFRDLPMSRDKTKSQIDFLVDSLQLSDPSIRSAVKEINNRGLLGEGYWFWYHQPARRIEVIRPTPPTFCPQDKDLTGYALFRRYEKETGEKVLLKSWRQVPRFTSEGAAQELNLEFLG